MVGTFLAQNPRRIFGFFTVDNSMGKLVSSIIEHGGPSVMDSIIQDRFFFLTNANRKIFSF